jgi:N-acetylmuramoyl-L-alanine amidase
VSRGETLSGIAQRYGVTIGDMRTINRLRADNSVHVGDVLQIPSS